MPERGFGQLWQVPTFLLGVVCLAFAATTSTLRSSPAAAEFRGELAQLRQALDDKTQKTKPWLEKCPALLARAERFPALAGEAYFLVGSLYCRMSEEAPAGQAESQRSKAEEYLDKALQKKGVADRDQARLKFRLGTVLYRQGQEMGRAVELMKEGLSLGADPAGGGYELLLQAILKQSNPNLEEALKICKRWLERSGDNEENFRARVSQGELFIRMDRKQDAIRALEPVVKSSHKELRLKALVLQARCHEAEAQWRQAQKIWEGLLKDANAVPGGKSRILYSLGQCIYSMDPAELQAAFNYWNQVLAMGEGSEEAQASSLRMGEAQLAGDVDAALRCWAKALNQVRKPADYRNTLISVEQARDMFEAAASKLMDAQNYQAAGKLAELYERLAQPPRAELYRAQVCKALALKAAGAEAALLYDKAGQAFEQAARTSAAADQAEYFWRAAECFQQARKFDHAARVLEKFVKIAREPLPLAEGWLALGEAHLALKNQDKARQALMTCIDIPATPSADRARCLLAVLEKNARNFDKALALLKDISARSLNRSAYEDALFLQGMLLVQMEKFGQAEINLEAAIKECPGHPGALRARADLAECYRKEADRIDRTIKDGSYQGDLQGTVRIYEKKRREKLLDAATMYEGLADELKQRIALKVPLSQEQYELLRQSAFGNADVLLEMGDTGEALRRYQRLQELYRNQVECLFACERIWRCVPRVVQTPQKVQEMKAALRSALAIAESDLGPMNPDSSAFQGKDVYTKQNWLDWINERKAELNKTP